MRTVVGVLRGGPSSEYAISLMTGANVLAEINREKYEPRDIFIDKKGQWHVHGIAATPERALRGVDVAFNALHGAYGEDGQVQRVLDALAVPYTGSGAFASAVAFNKHHTKELAKKLGIQVAHGKVFERPDSVEDMAMQLFRSFPHPAIVKPVIGGSSVGTNVARSYHGLEHALYEAFSVSPKVLVEEFIPGREATVGVIDGFRGEKSYVLLPIEIIPPQEHPFFSYDAKYSGKSQEISPGNFSPVDKQHLMRFAKTVHEELGLAHYSRSDFIVSPRGIYFLEVNTLPGLTKESLLPKALSAVGAKVGDFIDHVVTLAHKGAGR